MKIFREFDKKPFDKLHKYPPFMKYKYTYLVIAVVAQFVLPPLFEEKVPLVIPVLFLILMLTLLGTLDLNKYFFRVMLGLGCVAFVFSLSSRILQMPYREGLYFYVAGLSITAIFLLVAVLILIMKIFSEKVITAETIKGGIAVYFMMGFLWAFLYTLLILLHPDSISFPMGSVEYSDITYFSFTTLTTLGYGDVTPVSWLARNLTILESTFGQIYLTVLIARLVGLHVAAKSRSADNK